MLGALQLHPLPPLVLLLDDDVGVTTALARGLRRHGYRLDVHNSGTSAVMRISSPPAPDVIVTDWNMPGVDGETFLRFVAERCPRSPVIIITGDTRAVEVPSSAGSCASFSLLRKPFHPELLHQQITRVLESE
jgi:DNA-binding NtrC family response regulator